MSIPKPKEDKEEFVPLNFYANFCVVKLDNQRYSNDLEYRKKVEDNFSKNYIYIRTEHEICHYEIKETRGFLKNYPYIEVFLTTNHSVRIFPIQGGIYSLDKENKLKQTCILV